MGAQASPAVSDAPSRPPPEIGGFLRAVATASAAAAAGTLKLPDPAAMALSAMAVQQPPMGAVRTQVRWHFWFSTAPLDLLSRLCTAWPVLYPSSNVLLSETDPRRW
jgi:hypothetical protein